MPVDMLPKVRTEFKVVYGTIGVIKMLFPVNGMRCAFTAINWPFNICLHRLNLAISEFKIK